PFELTIRDEWAYARGVTDDKGQVYILLKAAQKLVEANALPVNLRFACDGEEETGGDTIVKWIERDDRGADAGSIFDGGMLRMDVPAIELATRGLIAFDVEVQTGDRDLHSGMYGGAALNAVHVLMRCFSAVLAGENGLLPEPLRAGIAAPTSEELASWSALPPGSEELDSQGATPLDPNAGSQFYIRTFAEPSADITAFLPGHPPDLPACRGGKPGRRNPTLSGRARGQVTTRLAPGQALQTIGTTAERLMRDAAPAGASVDIAWDGAPPGRMNPDSPVIKLGQDAFERVLGVRPLLLRTGGTLPIMPALEHKGIPTVLTGFGLPESNVHSPNERFLVRYFEQGVDTAAALYTAFGELPTS